MSTAQARRGRLLVGSKQLSTLARRVKKLREQAGLSQQALAVKAGLSVSVVSQLEQGNKGDPRVSTARAIAAVLGVQIEELFQEDATGD